MVPRQGCLSVLLPAFPVDRTDVFHEDKREWWADRVPDVRAESEMHQSPTPLRRNTVYDEDRTQIDHADWHRQSQGLDSRVMRDADDNQNDRHHGEWRQQYILGGIESAEILTAVQRSEIVAISNDTPRAHAEFVAAHESEQAGDDRKHEACCLSLGLS